MSISDKISRIISLIIFLTGLICVLIGVTLDLVSNNYRNLSIIQVSVGSSLIASSIVAYITLLYTSNQIQIKEIIEKWGLLSIYNTRADMNISANKKLSEVEKEIDFIVLGMRGLRDAKSELIRSKVAKGLKIRIITMKPTSSFVEQRELEENRIKGEIRKTIEDLVLWVDELKRIAPSTDRVSIRYYDACPQDSYMRVDNKIYIGPNHFKKTSQQTISYEFGKNLLGYMYFSDYFEKLWNDKDFVSENY